MRLLHTSDWHLGRSLFGVSLLEEQTHALTRLLEVIDERSPDALLIAGDIFDRSVPPEDAVELLDWFLHAAVVDKGTPIFLIPGNHDSAERIGFGARLLRDKGLTIFSRVEDAWNGLRLERSRAPKGPGRAEAAAIYGIPYHEPAFVAERLPPQENARSIRSHDDALNAICDRVRTQHAAQFPDLPAVLLAHAFVTGGEESVESERPLSVGGSSSVDASAFHGFAYVALGHLHKPQRAGANHVRYSGSLLPYSKSEATHAKGALLAELFVDGRIEIEAVPLPPRRALRAIEGELHTLLETARGESALERDAFVIASLLDRGPAFDAFGKLRELYPRLLHVGRSPLHLPDLLPGAPVAGATLADAPAPARRSALDVFAEFFSEATGEPMSETELKLLRSIARDLEPTNSVNP